MLRTLSVINELDLGSTGSLTECESSQSGSAAGATARTRLTRLELRGQLRESEDSGEIAAGSQSDVGLTQGDERDWFPANIGPHKAVEPFAL